MADTFDVIDIQNTVSAPAGGIAGPALRIHFVTKPSGINGAVEIPAAQFTDDEARRAITAQAAALERVMGL